MEYMDYPHVKREGTIVCGVYCGSEQPGHCPGKILVNCVYCLPHTILSCGTMGQSPPTVRTTDQSKVRRLGGGTGFFSTHKLKVHTVHVACPDNLAALKPPLM